MIIDFPVLGINQAFGGAGYLAGELSDDPEIPHGIVTVNDVPGAREIRVSDRLTGRLVAVTWSNTDGTYRIDGLNPTLEFDVVARDWSRTWQDVIVGAVKPQPYEP